MVVVEVLCSECCFVATAYSVHGDVIGVGFDQQCRGHRFDAQPFHCQASLTNMPMFTEQYELVST